MVDIEADGRIPGDYSMVCFGAALVEPSLATTFYGRMKPISENWIPDALAVSGFTRDETLGFDDPKQVMEQFAEWLRDYSRGLDLPPLIVTHAKLESYDHKLLEPGVYIPKNCAA
ncbi:MAG: hypothetical protein KAV87_67060 [Desulfobacteraceae bacterium]|nr:hypothetical protein [Desulfobacteraceae bacterium]